MECLLCWKDCKVKFCRECREKKQNATAIISQNKKKMLKLLNETQLSPERFDKFILYANNIVKHWKIVIDYRGKDTRRTFTRILEFWTL